MRLGEFHFDYPVCSAPMAGVSDKSYRLIARDMACDLVWTEMISATALTYSNSKTMRILDISGEKVPVVVQLFGSKPEVMAEAAKIAVENGARIIDINMGCPAPKIVKNCEGSALLKDIPLAQKVAAAVVNAVDAPVMVKMRLGWSADDIVAEHLAKLLEDTGVCAISVHGRTRDQYYSGKADWAAIGRVKKSVKIPVIGNGDIWRPEDAAKMKELTGCDGVMIGRGSLGNPWIFGRTASFLKKGELIAEPSALTRIKMAQHHLALLIEFKGELAVQEMRKHAAWYIKGLREAARVRDLIMATRTAEEMNKVLAGFAEHFYETHNEPENNIL